MKTETQAADDLGQRLPADGALAHELAAARVLDDRDLLLDLVALVHLHWHPFADSG